jgi:hypothetical protein
MPKWYGLQGLIIIITISNGFCVRLYNRRGVGLLALVLRPPLVIQW